MITQLYANTKVSRAITVTNGAAGTTDITGATIDMEGFEGVMFILQLGAITSGAVTSAKVQGSTSSDMSSPVDLAGTGQTIADTDDEKVLLFDVAKVPTYRYLALYVDRG